VALPAFAAERRAAAPLLLSGAGRAAIDRRLSPARRAHSSKPAARSGVRRANGTHTERETDGRPEAAQTPLTPRL